MQEVNVKRAELIQLLTMPELPASYRIEKMTIHELRDEAKKRNLRGFWGLRLSLSGSVSPASGSASFFRT